MDSQSPRDSFIQKLPERAKKLELAWARLYRLNWDDGNLRNLQDFFAKLAAGCASHNLPAISIQAQYLATYLRDLIQLRRLPGSNELAALQQQVAQLAALMRAPEQAPPHNSLLAPQPPAPAARHAPIIYVIEPDANQAQLLQYQLQADGFRARTFASAQTCLAPQNEPAPSAILLNADLHLNALPAFVSHLKKRFNNIPLLLLSARSDATARLRAIRAGCDDYVSKPIASQRLREKLLRSLARPERQWRILLADDSPAPMAAEVESLRDLGANVLTATSPLQCLELANGFRPDLLVIDLQMPGINDMELARLLRQDADLAQLPIVFITSDSDLHKHSQIRALGINALLVKPLQPGQLVAICQQALASDAAFNHRVAQLEPPSTGAQACKPSHFFYALEQAIARAQPGQELSAIYYLAPGDINQLSQALGKVALCNLHQAFCEQLGNLLAPQEHWVELGSLCACLLAEPHSLAHHRQRAEQLSARLNRLFAQVGREQPVTLRFHYGLIDLHPSLGNASKAIAAAQEQHLRQGPAAAKALAPSKAPAQIAHSPMHLPSAHLPYLQQGDQTSSSASQQELPLDINSDLVLAFQPIISLEDARIEHFSVVSRLRRDDGELIPASQFLQQLRKPGKRLELDRWVLQKAVSAMTQENSTRENATLFLHLDKATLAQPNFFPFAANVLRSSRLRGSARLVFMIEEPWAAENPAKAQKITQQLLDIDFGACLTQVGSTAQTLSLLEKLPLTYARLSPLLTGNHYNPEQLAAVLDAAKRHHVEVIATHIEDYQSLSALWRKGVRLFEGFFIQAPNKSFRLHNDLILAREFVQQNNATARE